MLMYNRWLVYYATEWSVSFSVSPCRVMYKRGPHYRVELSGGERRWVFPSEVFKTSEEAHRSALERRGVNAYS